MSEAPRMERLSNFMGGRFSRASCPFALGLICGLRRQHTDFVPRRRWFRAPLLALMPVYFWCLVRPDLMSPAAAFVIGMLEDILSGGPPGVWARVLCRRPMP